MFRTAITVFSAIYLSLNIMVPINYTDANIERNTVEKLTIEDIAEPIPVEEEPADISEVLEVDTLLMSSSQIIEVNTLTEEEIELIALVTMAEAEGESELGKRLVIDTILNRVDSEVGYFPDTVYDVVYQKHAFSSMWNGRVDRVEATEEVCQLVREEMVSRTNYDTVYFHAKKYSKYGTPLFSEGNHYFSGV